MNLSKDQMCEVVFIKYISIALIAIFPVLNEDIFDTENFEIFISQIRNLIVEKDNSIINYLHLKPIQELKNIYEGIRDQGKLTLNELDYFNKLMSFFHAHKETIDLYILQITMPFAPFVSRNPSTSKETAPEKCNTNRSYVNIRKRNIDFGYISVNPENGEMKNFSIGTFTKTLTIKNPHLFRNEIENFCTKNGVKKLFISKTDKMKLTIPNVEVKRFTVAKKWKKCKKCKSDKCTPGILAHYFFVFHHFKYTDCIENLPK